MDPRDFTLVAFGGAGPLHACEAAERLDIPRVLVPEAPGVLCALGLLIADVAVDYSRSVMRAASAENLLALARPGAGTAGHGGRRIAPGEYRRGGYALRRNARYAL